MTDGQSFADFLHEIAEFARRLQARDMVVTGIEANAHAPGWGGSWCVIVNKGNEALRLWWDGRERYVIIEISPIEGDQVPNNWRTEIRQALHKRGDNPLVFVEDYLTKRYWMHLA